ncbi:hypothetical protein LY76DRAFT_593048 [Colletotrichum caudatum]|nr:hypothetical protein LY76DRAFT_593048 [Colletotrichum caudatum]
MTSFLSLSLTTSPQLRFVGGACQGCRKKKRKNCSQLPTWSPHTPPPSLSSSLSPLHSDFRLVPFSHSHTPTLQHQLIRPSRITFSRPPFAG